MKSIRGLVQDEALRAFESILKYYGDMCPHPKIERDQRATSSWWWGYCVSGLGANTGTPYSARALSHQDGNLLDVAAWGFNHDTRKQVQSHPRYFHFAGAWYRMETHDEIPQAVRAAYEAELVLQALS